MDDRAAAPSMLDSIKLIRLEKSSLKDRPVRRWTLGTDRLIRPRWNSWKDHSVRGQG